MSTKITLFLKKKKLNDFAIFIGANEEIAEKKLLEVSLISRLELYFFLLLSI